MFVVNRRLKQKFFAAAFAATAIAGISLAAGNHADARTNYQASSNIGDYTAEKLDDFSAVMHVTKHDDNALRKISKDFGLIYKLQGDVKVRYKDENKLRLDARVGAQTATLIVNGSKQYVRVSIGLKNVTDLGKEPGKRKTLLDVGMLSSGNLAYIKAEFRGMRPFEGVQCGVFSLSYKDPSDTSKRIVWIDPKTKIILKREDYDQGDYRDGKVIQNKLIATYYYREPKEIAKGIWFPSRIEVFNNEGQRGGETVYKDVKVNQGLEDSIFVL